LPYLTPGSAAHIPLPAATQGTVPGGHTVTAPRVEATPATGPDIAWPPIGGAPVMLSYVQFTDLLKQITTRRNTLQQVRTTHKNNIAALASVPAIVAYDITAGW
ncbi:MAG TPA: hypothetical protein VKE42_05055, partial [Candidatus Cybelea sp.]|nr:hypothetical protein [Candidatus Cybelea sp.]